VHKIYNLQKMLVEYAESWARAVACGILWGLKVAAK